MGTWAGTVLDSSMQSFSILSSMSWFEGVIKGIIIFLIFLWIVSIIWVARDVSSRTSSSPLQIVSILLVTFFTPVIGLPLYLVIRPIQQTKDTIPWREACATSLVVCYNCKTLNPKEYTCCIACWEQLKVKCKECWNTYPHDYYYCNVCGAPNLDVEEG